MQTPPHILMKILHITVPVVRSLQLLVHVLLVLEHNLVNLDRLIVPSLRPDVPIFERVVRVKVVEVVDCFQSVVVLREDRRLVQHLHRQLPIPPEAPPLRSQRGARQLLDQLRPGWILDFFL